MTKKCEHKWFFDSEKDEKGEEIDICFCSKCGKRKQIEGGEAYLI